MPKLRFAVFGHPVAHSVSPAMHRAVFRSLGLTHTYEAVDVPDVRKLEQLVDAIRVGHYSGANVTVPHKRAVLDFVDRVDASATQMQAANTLVRSRGRVIAYNTDAAGLADDLREVGAVGRTAAVIGSGGAASAAVAALSAIGSKVISVTSRSWDNSEELVSNETAEKFRAMRALPCAWPIPTDAHGSTSRLSEALRLQWADVAASADVIVQATSAGMKGADPGDEVAAIVPWERVSKNVICYDLVYNPAETPFLRAARERGVRGVSGLGMLARQGAHALALWLKITPDVEVMRAAAEKSLQQKTR